MPGNMRFMSDAAVRRSAAPHGLSLLPRALSASDLRDAPVLLSEDALLIDDLSSEEDDAFATALEQ